MEKLFNTVSNTTSGLTYSLQNISMYTSFNNTDERDNSNNIESYLRVIIPILFSLIVVIGFLGNLLVIVVIIINKQMRNAMNLLILNLAVADICFILFCVPFTGAEYVLPKWPFGDVWCKIVQFLIYVFAYASVYTLVLMSLHRYLAIVCPLSSISFRNQANTVRLLVILWVLVLAGNSPLLFTYVVIDYTFYGEDRSACISKYSRDDNVLMLNLFHLLFLVFGYILPLSLICVLYGLMLKRLLFRVIPGASKGSGNNRSMKRTTKMIIIVVAAFALCWLPIHVVFMLQRFGTNSSYIALIQIAGNCLSYMNSCVNPILYAIFI